MGPQVRRVGISGVGSYVPERVLTNFDLMKIVDTSDEWIVERTGIRERHICDDGQATSDMASVAARRALEHAGVTPEELDLIIVATVTPDMIFPSTSCLVQAKIGATNACAFDISAGCTGFVYALSIGSQFIAAGTYDKVLIVGAEALSRVTDWTHRNTCVLFGDGAGAAVLEPIGSQARPEDRHGVITTVLKADGSLGDILKIPAGGSRLPASHETVDGKLHYIHMEGNRVYKFAVRVLVEGAKAALEKASLKEDDIDYFIPHQANQRLVDIAGERLGVSDRVYSNVERYGNTSAASIPIALDEAVRSGRIRDGDLVMLVGFGAGLTWGASIIRWCKGLFDREKGTRPQDGPSGS